MILRPRQTAGLLLALGALACGGGASGTADGPEAAPNASPEAHQHPMLGSGRAEPPADAPPDLAAMCRASRPSTDPYFGEGQLVQLESQDQRLSSVGAAPRDRVRLLVPLSEMLMRQGRLDEAREKLAEARELLSGGPAGSGLRIGVLMQSAVASLRLAEEKNCRERYGAESCILPIRGDGVHADPTGSREAIGFLTEVLSHRATDPAARYLLNLAYMTLGEWPQGVPQPFRMPAAFLDSEHDIGRFRNVAPDRGVDVWSLAGGVVLDDLDSDGDLDILVSSWDPCAPLRHFRNRGDGTFDDVSEESGVHGQLGGLNLIQADADGDGDIDVLVLRGGWQGGGPLGAQRNSLLLNRGDGSFEDVTRQAGLAEPALPTQAAAWGDYDADGDLDLYVCNEGTAIPGSPPVLYPGQLFRNDDGAYIDVAGETGVDNGRYCKGAVWGDYDNDGDPDLYLSNYDAPNRLYRNEGGRFVDVAKAAGAEGPEGSFPVWFWDYDNDGWLDLFVGVFNPDPRLFMSEFLGDGPSPSVSRLLRNNGRGGFEDRTVAVGGLRRAQMLMGANYGDLDNDGWLDFYGGVGATNLEALFPNPMYRNDQGTRFQDVTGSGGFGHLQKGHGIAFGDIDEDGDQDVYLEVGAAFLDDAFGNALFENPGHGARWVKLLLAGTTANRSAIGARVKVVTRRGAITREIHRIVGSGGSFGANPLRVEIGLGDARRIEQVEVRWPGPAYETETFSGVEPKGTYRLQQGTGVSVRLDGKESP